MPRNDTSLCASMAARYGREAPGDATTRGAGELPYWVALGGFQRRCFG